MNYDDIYKTADNVKAMEFNGFHNEFNSELEAIEQIKKMEIDGFFTNSAWLGFEIKKVFVED